MAPPTVTAADLPERPNDVADRLVNEGILRSSKPGASATCPDCGNLLRVQIEFDRAAKVSRGYISCPDCGINETNLDLLRRWNIDIERLLLVLFARSTANISLSQIISGRIWRIGKAKWAGRQREILFALGKSETAEIAIVGKRPKSILFVLEETDAACWSLSSPNIVIAIESVVAADGDGIAFDVAHVEAKIAAANSDASEVRPKPPKKRGSRTAGIEALKKELVDHIRAAREHAVATRDLTGTPELLTCPTKEKLGELAGGMGSHTVSRCFNDPAGHELKTLWELAHDLDRIIAYRS